MILNPLSKGSVTKVVTTNDDDNDSVVPSSSHFSEVKAETLGGGESLGVNDVILYADHLRDLQRIQTIAKRGVADLRKDLTEEFRAISPPLSSSRSPSPDPLDADFFRQQLSGIKEAYDSYKIRRDSEQEVLRNKLQESNNKFSRRLKRSTEVVHSKLEQTKRSKHLESETKDQISLLEKRLVKTKKQYSSKLDTMEQKSHVAQSRALAVGRQENAEIRADLLRKLHSFQVEQELERASFAKTQELLERQLMLESSSHCEEVARLDNLFQVTLRSEEHTQQVLRTEVERGNAAKEDAEALSNIIQELRANLESNQSEIEFLTEKISIAESREEELNFKFLEAEHKSHESNKDYHTRVQALGQQLDDLSRHAQLTEAAHKEQMMRKEDKQIDSERKYEALQQSVVLLQKDLAEEKNKTLVVSDQHAASTDREQQLSKKLMAARSELQEVERGFKMLRDQHLSQKESEIDMQQQLEEMHAKEKTLLFDLESVAAAQDDQNHAHHVEVEQLLANLQMLTDANTALKKQLGY